MDNNENIIYKRFNVLSDLEEWIEIEASKTCTDLLRVLWNSPEKIISGGIALACEIPEDIDEILLFPEDDPLVFSVQIEKLDTPVVIDDIQYGVSILFGWDSFKQNFLPSIDQECFVDLVLMIRTEFETYLLALVDAADDDLERQWDEIEEDNNYEENYEQQS